MILFCNVYKFKREKFMSLGIEQGFRNFFEFKSIKFTFSAIESKRISSNLA